MASTTALRADSLQAPTRFAHHARLVPHPSRVWRRAPGSIFTSVAPGAGVTEARGASARASRALRAPAPPPIGGMARSLWAASIAAIPPLPRDDPPAEASGCPRPSAPPAPPLASGASPPLHALAAIRNAATQFLQFLGPRHCDSRNAL